MPSAAPSAPAPRGRWGVAWRSVIGAALGGLVWSEYAASAGSSGDLAQFWLVVVDPVVGVVTLVATLVWVRRHPLAVGLLTALASCVSATAAGGATIALGSVATRRRWPEILLVAAANIGAGFALDAVHPNSTDQSPWWVAVIIGILVTAVIVAVGVAVGQRRELLAGLRERAETAEREQAAREEAARVGERNRIAREMHDVLAHRISLVAMHAGALGFRTDLTREEQATAARTIEENAHLALQELRDVLGVLREPTSAGLTPERPQPLLGDVPDLVAEARGAGMRVELADRVTGTPPATVSRTAYRVVQEGLTNARKHAPDTRVSVRLAGDPDEGLTIRVTNPTSVRVGGTGMPGAGVGLLGLGERVSRLGGRISHGPGSGGGYELSVWLPWST
ncbi:putative two-component system sensor kinase [Nostocoides japonicum T1-X7]|uniref:histidine kinase n=1 Tax=Nostocoides japonicum T1-X7 TaxID=1194083 RepID=A0A077LUE7_9MICO|nr:histidine kinase [Tetrasphaera japonica]CCH76237.1 putative two-component system sensor kinase [Tetrasphaera japonica T1-X7]